MFLRTKSVKPGDGACLTVSATEVSEYLPLQPQEEINLEYKLTCVPVDLYSPGAHVMQTQIFGLILKFQMTIMTTRTVYRF